MVYTHVMQRMTVEGPIAQGLLVSKVGDCVFTVVPSFMSLD